MAKLRHIAMQVPDPWQAAEFYMRVFGMKKVGRSEERRVGKECRL